MLGFSAGAFQGKSKAAEQATKKKTTKEKAASDSDSVLENEEGEEEDEEEEEEGYEETTPTSKTAKEAAKKNKRRRKKEEEAAKKKASKKAATKNATGKKSSIKGRWNQNCMARMFNVLFANKAQYLMAFSSASSEELDAKKSKKYVSIARTRPYPKLTAQKP
jgi:hypothetical protein